MPRYFAYVRKSTERKERQVLSVPGQIKRIQAAFPDLDIIFLPPESKSAFKPYNRPIFEEMISRIRAGEADGIVAWQPNRLARNEIDAGTISYMLRTGELADLKFTAYQFENTPEGLLALQNLMSQSQYESSKLQINCKAGMSDKADLGYFPAKAPLGYINSGPTANKGERYIYPDEKRLPMVERALRLALTGDYTTPELRQTMERWGFTDRNGKVPSYAAVRKMVRNVFYTGYFRWDGKLYNNKGTYPAIIKMDEHKRLLEIMARRDRGTGRRLGTRDYVHYTGLMKCGNCGGMVIVTEKRKHYAGTGRDALYLYYHCTRKKRGIPCREAALNEADLVSSFEEEVSKHRLIPEFRDSALEILENRYAAREAEVVSVRASRAEELKKAQQKLQRLIDMRAAEEIDATDFQAQQARYKKEISDLSKNMRTTDAAMQARVQRVAASVFNDLAIVGETFREASPAGKKRILIALSSNLRLKDRKVLLEAKKWYAEIRKGYSAQEAIYLQARTSKNGSTEARSASLMQMIPNWWSTVHAVADLIEEEIAAGGSVLRLIADDVANDTPQA